MYYDFNCPWMKILHSNGFITKFCAMKTDFVLRAVCCLPLRYDTFFFYERAKTKGIKRWYCQSYSEKYSTSKNTMTRSLWDCISNLSVIGILFPISLFNLTQFLSHNIWRKLKHLKIVLKSCLTKRKAKWHNTKVSTARFSSGRSLSE